MISFACKQCGKRHERPDEAAGTLIFCECGQGNRVPWENTSPPPETSTPAKPAETPRQTEEAERDRPRRRPRWRESEERDPALCLNHRSAPSRHPCAACGASFCDACVVTLQGETLCGPCKNYRLHSLHRPPRLSVLAIIALVVALAGGPVAFCLVSSAAQLQAPGFGLVGLLPEVVALVLGLVALRQIETDPKIGGRAMALTGIIRVGRQAPRPVQPRPGRRLAATNPRPNLDRPGYPLLGRKSHGTSHDPAGEAEGD